MDLLDHPRYQEKPVLLFFEKFVLDIIGELESKQRKILDELDLKTVFGTQSSHWRDVIIEVLHLSNTIQIAVLDEWFKYIDGKEQQNQRADAISFTQEFADEYFNDNSGIDVWPNEDSLEAARVRIKQRQKELDKERLF
ncbi:MAG: hypothetical protein OEX19_12785 [Gammaproteobacteria bacterium]|nr:hypothetical protein [Gammaproteobacteria bacterium]